MVRPLACELDWTFRMKSSEYTFGQHHLALPCGRCLEYAAFGTLKRKSKALQNQHDSWRARRIVARDMFRLEAMCWMGMTGVTNIKTCDQFQIRRRRRLEEPSRCYIGMK